jgi:hypothetical protein
MNGSRGFAVELLIDDAFDQGLEGRLRACDSQGEGAGAFDELTEFGIALSEFAARESGIVARRTWTAKWTRHVVTVSQAG